MATLSAWPGVPSITTQRLLIRPWQRSDLDLMAAWPPFDDPLEAEWNWPQQLQRLGTVDLFYLMRATDARRREWTIARGDEVIGYLGIREIDLAHGSARLGLGLGAPYTEQGYGSEALGAFLDTYFGALRFRLLRLDVAAHNERARRLYERLGFREVAQRWQDDGAAADFDFLAAPRYEPLRRHFEVRGSRMLVQTLEMELSHAWNTNKRMVT